MQSTLSPPASFKLSVCITTHNGAATIGETLESIIAQAPDECEIVVLDGASTDGTNLVVEEYARRFTRLRYIRQDTNNGVDQDFDRVACLSKGDYCWLMSDDDLLKPGALAAVLEAVRRDVSMVVVNAEFCHPDNMSYVMIPRWIDIKGNQVYGPQDMDRLFSDMVRYFCYIGIIVIRRDIWLSRDRQRYYGTLFTAMGTIFQKPLPGETLVIAEPFVSIRSRHSRWMPRAFEIDCFKWPSVVWSLPFTDSLKRKVSASEPWRSIKRQLFYRAHGVYSIEEYKRWIRPLQRPLSITIIPALVALIPGVLINTVYVLFYSLPFIRYRDASLLGLRESPFYLRNWLISRRKSPQVEPL